MATQSRGAPYPLGTDANNTAADIQALSLWANDRPGVAALTTTQRNALTGVDRWDGKLVLDTTLDRLFRWDAGTTTWIQIADASEVAALLATTGTPNPEGTASRGVSASAARADHVHPLQTTAEITLVTTPAITLAANITNTGDGTRLFAKGGVVTVEVYVVANASVTDVLTVPAGFRPIGIIRGAMNLGGNATFRAVNLSSGGLLGVEGGMTAGQTLYGSITFVAA